MVCARTRTFSQLASSHPFVAKGTQLAGESHIGIRTRHAPIDSRLYSPRIGPDVANSTETKISDSRRRDLNVRDALLLSIVVHVSVAMIAVIQRSARAMLSSVGGCGPGSAKVPVWPRVLEGPQWAGSRQAGLELKLKGS